MFASFSLMFDVLRPVFELYLKAPLANLGVTMLVTTPPAPVNNNRLGLYQLLEEILIGTFLNMSVNEEQERKSH